MKYIQKIYENIIDESWDMNKTNLAEEKGIRDFMKQLEIEKISSTQYEAITDQLYEVTDQVKRLSFEVGFCYAVSLLMESIIGCED